MVTTEIGLPELGLVAGTRVLLGVGIGLLMADKLSERQRKSVGRTLLTLGVLTTLPLLVIVFGRRRRPSP